MASKAVSKLSWPMGCSLAENLQLTILCTPSTHNQKLAFQIEKDLECNNLNFFIISRFLGLTARDFVEIAEGM